MSFDSLVNRGDYFSAHYLAEVLPKDLKKKDGLFARWTEQEKAGRTTPRRGLRALGKPYFAARPYFADLDARLREGDLLTPDETRELRKELGELHGEILRALGYDPSPRELTVERAGKEYAVHVAHADQHLVAIECHWAADVDAALDEDLSGRLLHPVQLDNREQITSGVKLASWLHATDTPPRYVLILAGGVLVLADRAAWGEGRYLAVSLDVAFGRNNQEELGTIAALFGADSLLPPEEGGSEPLADLLANSRNHAVGVSKDLRDGLKESVELIANEVLDRIREQGVQPEEVMEPDELAKELGREALRYLYRILFLLYAEARPELGILPVDDEDYMKGYSMARLGELVVRDLSGEESRNGFHLYESLDLLFRMVNKGHRPRTGDEVSEDEGLHFEALRSDLFEPEAIRLIGRDAISLDEDDPDAPRIDTRLRNEVLHKVLRKLMLTKGRKKERGGFISYAQLGINQLGAVYEGLMSYSGFIAKEELYEVAKGGDAKDGSWMIPASKIDDYPSNVFVHRVDKDRNKLEEYANYRKGSFVYRLAGRDRETSASYYTPESLTKVTVQLALQQRLDQDGTVTSAREILDWKICEPALGSGAFLNEAINQVAAEYLKRRQQELGVSIDPEDYEEELQKVKAYIALHNAYGVDLNETAVELAEVSIWLNVMHPGLQAPWFGLHLRRGNSLIGAGRRVYRPDSLTKGTWLRESPVDVPFLTGAIPEGTVHHFLLPAEGWGTVAAAKEAKELAPAEARRLTDWRKKIRTKVSNKKSGGRKHSQLKRLQALARRAEYLWNLVQQRLTISEREISRRIPVWGADWLDHSENAVPKEKVYQDLTAPGTPYWRLKKVMDAWCALWFWPVDRVGLLDGSDDVYSRQPSDIDEVRVVVEKPVESTTSPANSGTEAGEKASIRAPIEGSNDVGKVFITESIFSSGDKQFDLIGRALEERSAGGRKTELARRRAPLAIEQRRSLVPLADLDDWIEFVEAVLGRADVPEDSLAASFATLADLEEYENQLPLWMGMDSELKLAERFPWLHVVDDIADQQGFFHWELQFAQVFSDRGGFDLQVGNPPWYRPRWIEAPVLAELEPWFELVDKPSVDEWRKRKAAVLSEEHGRAYYLNELATNYGLVGFLGSAATYDLLVGTQPNLYRGFMVRVWRNLSPAGIAGLLHPDTHFVGSQESKLRAAAYEHLRLHAHFHNRRLLFADVDWNVEYAVQIYGSAKPIGFTHISWLYDTAPLVESFDHDGTGEQPGIKYNGYWDLRPHRDRLVTVNEEVLRKWQLLAGESDVPARQAKLLYPVSVAEQGAIEALSRVQRRLGDLMPQISRGFDEASAKKEGIIAWGCTSPQDWSEVILRGPQFTIANPFAKQPPRMGRNDPLVDPATVAPDAVPSTDYHRATDADRYHQSQDRWVDHGLLRRLKEDPERIAEARNSIATAAKVAPDEVSDELIEAFLRQSATRRYTQFYRLAWREMIPNSTERSLFPVLIPPGPAHVHLVRSMALATNRETALVAAFWAGLPLDYLLRVTGRGHLDVSGARAMPVPDPEHPLAEALLLRMLRLNCLTEAYAELWADVYSPTWKECEWAVFWPGLKPLNDVDRDWSPAIPLRSQLARRAALLELDVIVAVMLNMMADELLAAYRSRFPHIITYESAMWFDSNGRRIAENFNAYGHGQTKEHFEQLCAHLDPDLKGPVPDGYAAPFYRADRETEYRHAHAFFSEQLRQAGWPTPDDVRNGGDGEV